MACYCRTCTEQRPDDYEPVASEDRLRQLRGAPMRGDDGPEMGLCSRCFHSFNIAILRWGRCPACQDAPGTERKERECTLCGSLTSLTSGVCHRCQDGKQFQEWADRRKW